MSEGITGNDGIKQYPIPSDEFIISLWNTIELDMEIEQNFYRIEYLRLEVERMLDEI